MEAPVIQVPLKDLSVSEGEQVHLDCTITARPEPEVIWYYDGCPVKESPVVKLLFYGDKCSLVIGEAGAGDSGTYRVVAINPGGEASSQCSLNVRANILNGVESMGSKEPESKPVFKKPPTDKSVTPGETVSLDCEVAGRPLPTVSWARNGSDLQQSDKIHMSQDADGGSTVKIKEVVSEDSGTYTAKATNQLGEAKASCKLVVKQPSHLSSLGAMKTDEHSLLREFTFYDRFTDNIVCTSSSTELECFTTGRTEPEIEIYKSQESSNMQTEFGNGFTTSVEESSGLRKRFPGLVNSKRKHSCPRFMAPLNGCIVDQDRPIILEAIVDGYPEPEVSWERNGHLIPEEAEVSYSFGKATLRIASAGIHHGGRYLLTAVNSAGSTTSAADVVVKKNSFPPVIGRRLQPKTLVVGERLHLEVEVTATPTPQISWEKDGKPITMATPEYRLISQGSSHSLIVNKVDHNHHGKYNFFAKNGAGEANSTAEVLVIDLSPESIALNDNVCSPEILKSGFPDSDQAPSRKPTVPEGLNGHTTVSMSTIQSEKTIYSTFDSTTKTPQIEDTIDSLVVGKLPEARKEEIKTSDSYNSQDDLKCNENIVTDSISTKSTLDFFKNIIKENEKEQERFSNDRSRSNKPSKMPESIVGSHGISNITSTPSNFVADVKNVRECNLFSQKEISSYDSNYVQPTHYPSKKENTKESSLEEGKPFSDYDEREFESSSRGAYTSLRLPLSSETSEWFNQESNVRENLAVSPPQRHSTPDLLLRPISPKPSPEGVAMEKLWTTQINRSASHTPRNSPLPFTGNTWSRKQSGRPISPTCRSLSDASPTISNSRKPVNENVTQSDLIFQENTQLKANSLPYFAMESKEREYLTPENNLVYIAETHTEHKSNLKCEANKSPYSANLECRKNSPTFADKNLSTMGTNKETRQMAHHHFSVKSLPKPNQKTSMETNSFKTSHQIHELDDIQIEPGSPPVFGFATHPSENSRKSFIEQMDLELEKQSSPLIPAADKIIPPSSNKNYISTKTITQKASPWLKESSVKTSEHLETFVQRPSDYMNSKFPNESRHKDSEIINCDSNFTKDNSNQNRLNSAHYFWRSLSNPTYTPMHSTRSQDSNPLQVHGGRYQPQDSCYSEDSYSFHREAKSKSVFIRNHDISQNMREYKTAQEGLEKLGRKEILPKEVKERRIGCHTEGQSEVGHLLTSDICLQNQPLETELSFPPPYSTRDKFNHIERSGRTKYVTESNVGQYSTGKRNKKFEFLVEATHKSLPKFSELCKVGNTDEWVEEENLRRNVRLEPGEPPQYDYAPVVATSTPSRGMSWSTRSSSAPSPLPHSQDVDRPPFFTTPLKDIAVVSGGHARFECIVAGHPQPVITWLKAGDTELGLGWVSTYRNGVCRLDIPHAYPYHRGRYTCTAINSTGQEQTSATLCVSDRERTFIFK